MISDKDMEDYARECVWLAHVTSDPQIREQLFEMAREWMAAAMREGKSPNRIRRSPSGMRQNL
jgi:hypothetical protein